jgi:ubiquitin-conjugating enzyme E2 Z
MALQFDVFKGVLRRATGANEPPVLPQLAMTRIFKDLKDIFTENMDGVYVAPDEAITSKIHALIVGPEGTPYEGGFYYFILSMPQDYPHSPPKVKLMTTGGNTVRFNPNLYADGKVCLSILGTWAGPSWSPVMSIQSVLISIRSLMCENPYFNEPGHEADSHLHARHDQSLAYNQEVRKNTLKVAILDMLKNAGNDSKSMPDILRDVMTRSFVINFDEYQEMFDRNVKTAGKIQSVYISSYKQYCEALIDLMKELGPKYQEKPEGEETKDSDVESDFSDDDENRGAKCAEAIPDDSKVELQSN